MQSVNGAKNLNEKNHGESSLTQFCISILSLGFS